MTRRREAPIKRINPSGEVAWVARYTNRAGKRKSAGSFKLRREAQAVIDAAHEDERRGAPETVGAYFETWTRRHPRSHRTNRTNEHRVERVLGVNVEGRAFGDWPFRDLKRRYALALVDERLTVQRPAQTGAVNILRALSAMAEDAITDAIAEVNFVRGVSVRANDPRIRKRRRPVRVFSFEEMHRFARAGGRWEPSAGQGRGGVLRAEPQYRVVRLLIRGQAEDCSPVSPEERDRKSRAVGARGRVARPAESASRSRTTGRQLVPATHVLDWGRPLTAPQSRR